MLFFFHAFFLRTATQVVEVRLICLCICVKYVVYTVRPHAMNVQFSMGLLTTIRARQHVNISIRALLGKEGFK
jgi:hypothetical protein